MTEQDMLLLLITSTYSGYGAGLFFGVLTSNFELGILLGFIFAVLNCSLTAYVYKRVGKGKC